MKKHDREAALSKVRSTLECMDREISDNHDLLAFAGFMDQMASSLAAAYGVDVKAVAPSLDNVLLMIQLRGSAGRELHSHCPDLHDLVEGADAAGIIADCAADTDYGDEPVEGAAARADVKRDTLVKAIKSLLELEAAD